MEPFHLEEVTAMAARAYDDLDLLVETVGEGQYRARVLASPTGRTPAVELAG